MSACVHTICYQPQLLSDLLPWQASMSGPYVHPIVTNDDPNLLAFLVAIHPAAECNCTHLSNIVDSCQNLCDSHLLCNPCLDAITSVSASWLSQM